MTDTGWVVVHDALMLAAGDDEDPEDVRATRRSGRHDAEHLLVRTVECVHGEVEMEMECVPGFDYGAEEREWSWSTDELGRGRQRRRRDPLRLTSDMPLGIEGRAPAARRTLGPRTRARFSP